MSKWIRQEDFCGKCRAIICYEGTEMEFLTTIEDKPMEVVCSRCGAINHLFINLTYEEKIHEKGKSS